MNATAIVEQVESMIQCRGEPCHALTGVVLLSVVLIKALQKTKHIFIQQQAEMVTLMSVCLVLVMMWVTYQLGISMELGCFLAGSVISSVGNPLTSTVESLINPIKDYFSCLFFTAIGLHVFPSFVLVELGTLMVATVIVVSFKFGASIVVMRLSLPQNNKQYSWVVAAGLSQVSEFSFVVSSRARNLGLISREVYLLILSLSTISLLLSPILWKIVVITDPSIRGSRSIYGLPSRGKSSKTLNRSLSDQPQPSEPVPLNMSCAL